jgi:hypothetical protein
MVTEYCAYDCKCYSIIVTVTYKESLVSYRVVGDEVRCKAQSVLAIIALN